MFCLPLVAPPLDYAGSAANLQFSIAARVSIPAIDPLADRLEIWRLRPTTGAAMAACTDRVYRSCRRQGIAVWPWGKPAAAMRAVIGRGA